MLFGYIKHHFSKSSYVTQCCFPMLNFEEEKNASGSKVFLIQFFVMNSNMESELKNLCHV